MPREAKATLRKRIHDTLKKGEHSLRELSQLLGESEKEIVEHLPNVARSLGPEERFEVDPARCLKCGFEFSKRERFSTPGKCPICRSERIVPPKFRIR